MLLGWAVLTRNNIAGIHGVLVFDETEAVHQLDLGDVASTMGRKMGLDIGLGDCQYQLATTRRRNNMTQLKLPSQRSQGDTKAAENLQGTKAYLLWAGCPGRVGSPIPQSWLLVRDSPAVERRVCKNHVVWMARSDRKRTRQAGGNQVNNPDDSANALGRLRIVGR
jgi:hypothetical protein